MSNTMLKSTKDMQYIMATDVGSTTTKARFFAKKKEGWRFIAAGEAPTTVEAPFEDVTMGAMNAIREVEEITGHEILKPDGTGLIIPYEGKKGVDLYCTTSSAGGGLQMMVGGLVRSMTTESANRAALGAGAIVMDALSVDDGRQPYEKIKRILWCSINSHSPITIYELFLLYCSHFGSNFRITLRTCFLFRTFFSFRNWLWRWFWFGFGFWFRLWFAIWLCFRICRRTFVSTF